MDYSASGGIGEEALSVVDSEAERKILAHSFSHLSCNSISTSSSQDSLMEDGPLTMLVHSNSIHAVKFVFTVQGYYLQKINKNTHHG